ncbi:MAG: glycosyltransferase family 4 protein [Bacteroidales bacterium]
MRILFIHSIGKCKFGGGEKWVVTAAAGLREKGHDVVIGGRHNSCLLEAAHARGIQTATFNILSDMSPYQVFRIARFLRRQQPDVVITRGRDLAVTGIAARLAGNPVVLVRHGLPLMGRIRKHLFLLKKLADGIITNTHSIKDLYEKNNWLPRDFTRVVYNGTEIGREVPEDNEIGQFVPEDNEIDRSLTEADKVRHDVPEDNETNSNDWHNTTGVNSSDEGMGLRERFPGKKVVLTVGRLSHQKGYHYLIDAITILQKKRNDLVFVVLGNGKLRRNLEAYARKQGLEDMIHFEGFVRDVSPYLACCDLFVLPSLYEGMSNAAMEAMAHGKPVIITNVNGAAELIPDPGKGVLIPPRCPESIANSVNHLLKNPQLRREMGREARKHVAENFPIASMVNHLESYLQEISGKLTKTF